MSAREPLVLRVFIVDDEAPARERLRTLLGDISGALPNQVVGEAENGVAALAALETIVADVVLIDIRMPLMGGIELSQHLIRAASPPAVVFTTAFDQHAVQAFELNAVDYLLKPIRAARLQQALQKVSGAVVGGGVRVDVSQKLSGLNEGPRCFLSFYERGKTHLIPVEQVVYLRADAKYVVARTVEREFLLDESLLHLEEEFAERFIRLHRSALAAKEALVGFEKMRDADGDHWVVLLNGVPEKLVVSRRQWPLVKEFIRAR